MAGFSSSPNGLHPKETSSLPSLTIKKLTPRRLPPIGFEGPKPVIRPPPPPPTPWSWYHRNCGQSPRTRSGSPTPPPPSPAAWSTHRNHSKNKPLSSLNRYNRQQNNVKKTSTSPKSLTNQLMCLHQLLSGRTDLLLEYVLHFLSTSEHQMLVQIIQLHSRASSAESASIEEQFISKYSSYPLTEYDEKESSINCHVTIPSPSDPSSRSESDQSPITRTDSEDPTQLTLSTELDSDYYFKKVAEFTDGPSLHTITPPPPAPEVIFLTCQKYCERLMAARRKKLILLFAFLFVHRVRIKINSKKLASTSKTPKISMDSGNNKSVTIPHSAPETSVTPQGALIPNKDKTANTKTLHTKTQRSNDSATISKIIVDTPNGSNEKTAKLPAGLLQAVTLENYKSQNGSLSPRGFTTKPSKIWWSWSTSNNVVNSLSPHKDDLKSPKQYLRNSFNNGTASDKVVNTLSSKKGTPISPRIKDSASSKSSENGAGSISNKLPPRKRTQITTRNSAMQTEKGNNNQKLIDSLPPQKEAIRPQAQNHTFQNGISDNREIINGPNSKKMCPVSNGCRSTRKKISEDGISANNETVASMHALMPRFRAPLKTVASRPTSSVEQIIPLPRRLPVPDKRENVILVPPMYTPSSGSGTPSRHLPASDARHYAPSIYFTTDESTSTADRTPAVHRQLPNPAYKPNKHVAATNIYTNPLGPGEEPRVPRPQDTFNSKIGETRHIGYPPIKMDEMVIIEMWCKNARTQEELLLLRKLPELVSDALKYQRMYQSLLQESQMSEFLLQVAQAIFEEMVSLDQLIKKILEVAQRLVSADRASLFLVDHRNFELVSTVFDLRYESNNDTDFSKKEIRIPINKGIAGHVAMSGETMNIPDAYSDERFNKAVDEATGYRTVSILCMPIKVRSKVIAVVQMVNKRDKEAFGNDDEAAFQVFSTFFGLALHHARLYDKIKRKEQKYKVALEVLGYHNTCAEEDVMNLLEEKNKEEKINYNEFALNPFEVDDVQKCKGILTMFDDLFDVTKFDVTVLARFVLTVKKNYRKVPYHNFDHGWAVANAMYVILKHDTENRFDYNNRLALFVASLCHDLDHRGYTNKFMSEIASPLATIYTTSTLEHHHFNMTVTILQQDGHNIFNHMSSEGYKDMLDSIRQCILATDLATLFPNLKMINELVFETPQFDWNDLNHSALGRSFCMTCADLCAAAKPFEIQLVTAEIITAEFYQQGDLERQAGRTPIPMMDRSRPEELPACQVGFLSQICLPCYTVLNKLFPTTEPMLMMTKQNLEIWKTRASAIEEKNKNQ